MASLTNSFSFLFPNLPIYIFLRLENIELISFHNNIFKQCWLLFYLPLCLKLIKFDPELKLAKR